MFIEYQAQFWLRNICDVPNNLETNISDNIKELIIEGLKEFPLLLKTIYNDYESFEEIDYSKSYHNLMDTIKLLYSSGLAGDLLLKNNEYFIEVNPINFKQYFKALPEYHFDALKIYGFDFKYFKNNDLYSEYKKCDSFHVYYKNSNSLLPAIKYLADQMPNAEYKEVYARNFTMFAIADYNSILLKHSIKREDINPLCDGILRTTNNNELWLKLVDLFINKYHLDSSVNLWSEIFASYRPVWDLKFNKGKKKIASVHINIGHIGIDLMPTSKQARDIYNDKSISLTKDLFNSIEHFINNQERGKPRATTVWLVLNTQEDIDSIDSILERILK